MATSSRKRSAKACRRWIEQYQHPFRLAVECGQKLAHPHMRRRDYGHVVAACAQELAQAARDSHALTYIAKCIQRGHGHNVFKRRSH